MDVLVLVNDVATMEPDQTTVALMAALHRRGHGVHVAEAHDVDMAPDGELRARARSVQMDQADEEGVEAVRETEAKPCPMEAIDVILVRTSPGRDDRPGLHEALLGMLRCHVDNGGLVLSDPEGLSKAASKLYISCLPPHTRPETLVSAHRDAVLAFMDDLDGWCVVKPLEGTQGRDVFLIKGPSDPNRTTVVDNLLRQGPLMVQAYLPEAPQGDTRLLLLDGRVIERDGHLAAIHRRPAKGEFRSNVHLGASTHEVPLTPFLRRMAEDVGDILRRDGLFLVGLDIVGSAIVECNVFAPGGLVDSSRYAGIDLCEPVVDAIERKVAAHREVREVG